MQLSKPPEPKDSKWTPDQWKTNNRDTKKQILNIQTTKDIPRTNKQTIQTNHLSLKTPNGLLIRDWDGRTTNCDGGNGLSWRFIFSHFFDIFFICSTLSSGPKWKMLFSKQEPFLYWKCLEKAHASGRPQLVFHFGTKYQEKHFQNTLYVLYSCFYNSILSRKFCIMAGVSGFCNFKNFQVKTLVFKPTLP